MDFITQMNLFKARYLFANVNEFPFCDICSFTSFKPSFLLTKKAVESVKIETPIDKSVVDIVNIRDKKLLY